MHVASAVTKIVLHVNAASIQKFSSDKNMLCSSLYYFKNTYTKQSETGPFQCDGKDLYSLSSYINLKIKVFRVCILPLVGSLSAS